jgi:hypothetical protein
MKYCMYLQKYVCKSPYSYYIVEADEDLTHFHVWSRRKSFNSTLYTEERVLNLIEEKYPGSIRIEKVFKKSRLGTVNKENH